MLDGTILTKTKKKTTNDGLNWKAQDNHCKLFVRL